MPLQKTVTAILAAIRHEANPVMLDFLPVSEGVEDHAAQTPLVVAKCARMIELWRRLIALELMAAAQAVDLRDDSSFRRAQRKSTPRSAQSLQVCKRTVRSAQTRKRSTRRFPAENGRHSGVRLQLRYNIGSSTRQRS